MTLDVGAQSTSVSLDSAATVELEPGQPHARLLIASGGGGGRLAVGGVPPALGAAIVAALDETLVGLREAFESDAPAPVTEADEWHRRVMAKATLDSLPNVADGTDHVSRARERAVRAIREILDWYDRVIAKSMRSDGSLAWISAAARERLEQARPSRPLNAEGLDELRRSAQELEQLGTTVERLDVAIAAHGAFESFVDEHNEAYTVAEMAWFRREIRTEGKHPMTDEQVRAAVCFDGRMLAIASAGSGKTSTMVAKTVYLIRRGLVPRERVLMLAFNTRAAEELQVRTRKLLRRNGIFVSEEDMKLRARTLHSFGFGVVRGARKMNGTKRRGIKLAAFLDSEKATEEKVHELIAELRRNDRTFERRWIQLRRLCPMARAYRRPPAEGEEGYEGADGQLYRHPEDVSIADWLFVRNVSYHYIDQGFAYPGIDLFHRHIVVSEGQLAQDEESACLAPDGSPVDALSAGSTLESTSAELEDGSLFVRLEAAFAATGLVLEVDEERLTDEDDSFEGDELVNFFLSFIARAKDVAVGNEELRERLAALPPGPTTARDQVALEVAITLRRAWDQELRDTGRIDYADMIGQAVEHLEAGRWSPTDDLILVDEFQDMSTSRLRLLKGLLQREGSRLFAVGDDWQGINGFAGSDVRAVTEFEREFGRGTILYLNETFRFPQSLATLSRDFVQKNPSQIRKAVKSRAKESTSVIRAYVGAADPDVRDAVVRWLEKRAERAGVPNDANDRPSVMLLGRNRNIYRYLSKSVVKRYRKSLRIESRTIHTSKGAEADYVVVPEMLRGRFPSMREADPVLQVVMPEPESFPLAEERRLFYVALTRARYQVSLLTITGRESPFLNELVKADVVTIQQLSAPAAAAGDENGRLVAASTAGDTPDGRAVAAEGGAAKG